jgi:hypothetical protein
MRVMTSAFLGAFCHTAAWEEKERGMEKVKKR